MSLEITQSKEVEVSVDLSDFVDEHGVADVVEELLDEFADSEDVVKIIGMLKRAEYFHTEEILDSIGTNDILEYLGANCSKEELACKIGVTTVQTASITELKYAVEMKERVQRRLDTLSGILKDWCFLNTLPFHSADELRQRGDLTDKQKSWLDAFIAMWELDVADVNSRLEEVLS